MLSADGNGKTQNVFCEHIQTRFNVSSTDIEFDDIQKAVTADYRIGLL
jgi:hypothetical protein